ncbi:MAG: trypsin-like serine protease [Lentisphaeria bacterium]|nr:trypsin-like serine protease [Lentisphaeria bacterium]
MRDRTLILTAFFAACAGTLLTLGLIGGIPESASAQAPSVLPEPKLPAAVHETASNLQDAFAATVEKSMPAVVLITSQKRVGVVSPVDYYRSRIEYREVPTGQGSGFFVREDGYILTNFHVVRDQDSFFITTNDGAEFRAKVVGIDPPSDLALLKIDGERKFETLKFAEVDRVKIGHWAIAIGAPFSLSRSVTVGVVSGMKRRGVGVNLHESYIQTDASINPGNSGGPLLNLAGEVIGVNDFIFSPSGGSVGISFAISADLAKHVANEMIEHGQVRRAWLGVLLEPLSREIRSQLNIEHGVGISQVYRDSPAAGVLQRGDVVLEIGGEPVDGPGDLQSRVYSAEPESELTVKFRRAGRIQEKKIKLEPAPRNWFRRSAGSRQELQAAGEQL